MPDLPSLLDTLLDLGIKHVNRVLIQDKADLTPLCHMMNRDGQSEVIGVLWTTELEKMAAAAFLKKKAHEIGAKAVSFMHEAWLYFPTEEDHARSNYKRASQHPDRKECVLIFATDGTHNRFAVYEMKRRHGTVVELAPIKLPDGVEMRANILEGIIPATTH